MEEAPPRFLPLAGKAAVAHTLTYILMGVLASRFFDYAALYSQPCSGMKPFGSRWVLAGPLLQPIRGLLFASVFYPFRNRIFGRRHGWLLMAWTLVAIGILATFAPAHGSIEGLIYTTVPVLEQLKGWFEIVPQALLFAGLLCFWVDHSEKRWLSWLLVILFCFVVLLFTAGLLATRG